MPDSPFDDFRPSSARREAELRAFLRLNGEINRSLRFSDVLHTGLEGIQRIIGGDFGCAILFAPPNDLELHSPHPLPPPLHLALTDLIEHPPLAPDSESTTTISFLGERIGAILAKLELAHVMLIPLTARDKAIGILLVEKTPSLIEPIGVDLLLSVGEQLGMAIENARLHSAIQDSENWHRTFMENSLDGFMAVDLGGRITYVNDIVCEIFGYNRRELIGMRTREVTADEGEETLRAAREELLAIGYLINRRSTIRTKAGQIRVVNYSTRVIKNENGAPAGFHSVFQDVTEQERLMEALARRNHELAVLNEIGKILSHPLEIQAALDQVCEQISTIIGLETVLIYSVDAPNESIYLIAHRGVSDQLLAVAQRVGLDDPLTRSIVVEGKRFALNDIPSHPEVGLDGPRAEKYLAGIGVPIRRGGTLAGILAIGSKVTSHFLESDVDLLESIGNQIGIALENGDLYKQMQERVRELGVLARFSAQIATTLDAQEIADRTLDAAKELLIADAGGTVRLREGDISRLLSARMKRSDLPVQAELRSNPATRIVLEENQPFLIEDLETETRILPELRAQMQTYGACASVTVPLITRRGTLGFLSIGKTEPHHWLPREVELLETLANHAANAIANARLFQDISRERNRMQAILDSNLSGLYATDPEGRFILFNRAAEQITGWSYAEVVNKTWEEIFGADGKESAPLIRQAIADKTPQHELERRQLQTRFGHLIPVTEAAAPLLDEQGNVIGAVGAFWDLSREQAAERTRSFFLNTVMHELGTGLTKTLLAINLLEDPQQPENVRAETWHSMTTAVRSLKELANRFLPKETNVTVLPSVKLEALRLYPLVHQVVNQFRIGAARARFRVHLTNNSVKAIGDRERVETILRNLIENALKYSPPSGMITVTVRRVTPRVEIAVEDEGPGIPSKERTRVLEPFYRGEAGHYAGGYGLGLAIARQFAADMGSALRIGGRRGKGARISFTLRREP